MNYQEFIGPTNRSQSLTADPTDTMNWYVQTLARSAKTRAGLYPCPGFQAFVTVSDVGGRALFTMNGQTFAIVGHTAYQIDRNATATMLGQVIQDSNPGQVETNGAPGGQALFASATNAYLYDLSTHAFTQVLTGDAFMIGMLDGYFIAFNPITSKIRVSDLLDGKTWDPTQFAQRSAAPDNWKAMLVNAPDVWLIGEQTGDVWYDAGTFPFPLAPRVGLNFKFGIIAPFSLCASGNSVLWLSRDRNGAGIVVRTVGYSPTRVSTEAVETAIANYARNSTIEDAEAFVYQQEGHTFYVLNFPTANASWAYDLDENLWHRRGKWNGPRGDWDVYRPRVHTYNFDRHLVADRTNGTISVMDVNIGTEADGSEIVRERTAPIIFDEHQLVPIRNLEVELEAGEGLVSGQGSNPLVMWRTSDDGGKTYGSERQESAGMIGEYEARVRFWKMGMARQRVNKMRVSDPIPWRVVGAFINNDEGLQRGSR